METRKLIRPKQGRMLFGVCVGLANYFNIDPVLVRLVFVILTIWGGAGIIIYIIGIFIMPEEKGNGNKNSKEGEDQKKHFEKRVEEVASEVRTNFKEGKRGWRGEQIFGLIVLLLGIIFLFQSFFSWFSFNRFWPLILVLVGVIILFGSKKELK